MKVSRRATTPAIAYTNKRCSGTISCRKSPYLLINSLPVLICALYALNELPHPDMILAVVFFITNPGPSLCSS